MTRGVRPFNEVVAGGAFLDVIGRRSDGDDYRLRVWYRNDGTVMVAFVRTLDGEESVLDSLVVPGLVVDPGDALNVRFRVRGGADPWLETQVWRVGDPAPDAPLLAHQDQVAPLELRDAGQVGLAFTLAEDWDAPAASIGIDEFEVSRATK